MPKLRYLRTGLYLGDLKKNRFEPSQALAMALSPETFDSCIDLSAEDIRTITYLKGETIDVRDLPSARDKGWQLVCVDGFALGFGKLNGGILKNKYESEFYFGSKGLEKAVTTIKENELLGEIFTQTDRINLTAKLWETSAEELASNYHEDTNYVIDEAYAKNVEINKAIVGEIFRQENKNVPFIYLGDYFM